MNQSNWLASLVFGEGVAHSVLVYALVISLGVNLGKIKICGVSLGIAFVLFAGIACGHFGLLVDEHLLHFIKEFGLILFVFAIGLQVGPSFFSSFKKAGMQMNIVAVSIVCLDIIVAIILWLIFSDRIPVAMMVGILTGATTNTPSLAYSNSVSASNAAAVGYSTVYPLTMFLRILSAQVMILVFCG